jgi:hypothetical protein
MLEIYNQHIDRCYPVVIGEYVTGNSNRIGGNRPNNVKPLNSAHDDAKKKYFCTIALDRDRNDLDVSFFINDEIDFCYEKKGILLLDGEGINFILHKPEPISIETDMASSLSMHSLYVGDEDFDSDDIDQIWTHHKIGGVPYFRKRSDDLLDLIKTKMLEGYKHLIQLSFPDSDDAVVSGTWPFHDNIFHIFAKEENGSYHFFAIWC